PPQARWRRKRTSGGCSVRRPARSIPTAPRWRRASRTARMPSRPRKPPRSRPAPAPPTTERGAPDCGRARLSRGRRDRTWARLRPRSGSGFDEETAEPALALAEFLDRLFERGAVEVRPVGRHEYELAVSRLPQQEVRQPLLAAGADDEIGVGNVG